MSPRLRAWLIGIAMSVSVLSITAGSCQQECPPGTYFDGDECEQVEGDDRFDD